MPIPRFVGRFNKYVTNPIARLVAGWLPPFAVVIHRGRVSGREYRTPVAAFRTKDGLVVALTYGADADWVKNVLKDGRCRVRRLGRVREATGPRIVTGAEGMKLVPALIRIPLTLLNVTEFLTLRTGPSR
jgi:deazaflavin-dependent oxidoreductase (nitroreductase family)